MLAQAKERAQRLMEENEQRMTADAERIKGDATREIEHERRKAVQDIRSQTTELALMVAEKVVRAFTEADRRLADEALEALSKSYQSETSRDLWVESAQGDSTRTISFQVQRHEFESQRF